jgi:AcrR family transcriptional regulator
LESTPDVVNHTSCNQNSNCYLEGDVLAGLYSSTLVASRSDGGHLAVARLTRQESHAQTQHQLLRAAREEIARKGVVAASVRSISEAAGYSQGAFYSCFDNKDALLLQLFEENLGTILSRLAGVSERIEAQLESGRTRGITKLVIAEMDEFFASTNPGTSFAIFAVELQLHANRSTDFSSRYEKVRSAFQTNLEHIMAQICNFLPGPPAIAPSHLGIALLSTSVGFWAAGSALPPETRRHILSTFFRVVVSQAGR